jgi:hypothetical protein
MLVIQNRLNQSCLRLVLEEEGLALLIRIVMEKHPMNSVDY